MGLASVARAERLKKEGRLCSWFLFFSLEFTLGGLLVPLSSCSDIQAPPPRLPPQSPLTEASFWTSARPLFCSGPALSHLLCLTFLSAYMALCFSWTLDSFAYSRQCLCFSSFFFFFLNQKIGGENGFLLALPPWLLRALVSWESCGCCSVAKPRLILCNPTDCSLPGFSVLPYLPEFVRASFHLVYRWWLLPREICERGSREYSFPISFDWWFVKYVNTHGV